MSDDTAARAAGRPATAEPDDDDLKQLLAKRQHAKPNKLTWVLLVLLVLSLGFAMGACVQKGVSTAAGGASSLQPPARPPGAAPSAAADPADAFTSSQPPVASDPAGAIDSGPAGRPGDLTVGTVESVDGRTLTITTPDGQTVTVEVPEGTSVTSAVEVPLGELPVGSTVVIRGSRGEDGTVTADSVAEGTGTFPGGGGPGGGLRPAP